jgi:hypothetical protein
MCQYCEKAKKDLDHANAHIASLLDAISVGTDADWETSEPMLVGGVQGSYTCVPPFVGQCQWKVDLASAGATNAQVIVSSAQFNSSIDYTGAVALPSGFSTLPVLAINIPASTTISPYSEWYPMSNSDKLYILVTAATNAAFVNLVFRQKRKTRKQWMS